MTVIPALLVSTATRWMGPPRMVRALAKAGFEVSLLTPRNSLAEKSRYVARVGYLPERATPAQWADAFAVMLRSTSPRIVLPCDDMAFRLLGMLVPLSPRDIATGEVMRMVSLVRLSIGDPAHYRTSVDKTLLMPAAEALGIRVPRYIRTRDAQAAMSFATTLGFPVVLKRGYGSAGDAVAICASEQQLVGSFAALARTDVPVLDGVESSDLLVQQHISGLTEYYSVAAWQGKVLAGFANEKLAADPWPMGPATVVRLHGAPRLHSMAAILVRAFGMTGLLNVEVKIHEGTGEAYLLEINRRFGPSTFRGSLVGVDLCAALHAALGGASPQTGTEMGERGERVRVNFPQEWLRDPGSRWLREYPVDVPWDEPELIAALLALRHQS